VLSGKYEIVRAHTGDILDTEGAASNTDCLAPDVVASVVIRGEEVEDPLVDCVCEVTGVKSSVSGSCTMTISSNESTQALGPGQAAVHI
jgi:hypothetical protein